MNPKTQEAINAAISKDWQKALELNVELAREYPDDVETLNRLARTYLELGEIAKAKSNYKKVLDIDPYNSIAEKNLAKLAALNKSNIKVLTHPDDVNTNIDPDVFLEEAGKTRILLLNDLAMPSVLASLKTGDSLKLDPQRSDVIVYSKEGKRVGKIEPDIANNLAKAIREGSTFIALVKSVQIKDSSSKPSLSIFVKEIYRSPKTSQSIFPNTSTPFTPYIREGALNILAEGQEVAMEEYDDQDLPQEEVRHKIDSGNTSQTSSLESLAEKEIEDDQSFEDD